MLRRGKLSFTLFILSGSLQSRCDQIFPFEVCFQEFDTGTGKRGIIKDEGALRVHCSYPVAELNDFQS